MGESIWALRHVTLAGSKGGIRVAVYRLYRLDGAGRISTAEWVEADDDSAAEALAAELSIGSGSVELWARNRLIARVDPPGQDQLGASDPLAE